MPTNQPSKRHNPIRRVVTGAVVLATSALLFAAPAKATSYTDTIDGHAVNYSVNIECYNGHIKAGFTVYPMAGGEYGQNVAVAFRVW